MVKKYQVKEKEAAALKYNPGDRAPKVVAKGKGEVAEKIIKIAEENKVPLYEDPELIHMLNMLEIGNEIPPELYEIVAQVLVFVSDIDRLKREMNQA